MAANTVKKDNRKKVKVPADLKKQVDKILKEDESARKERLLKLKKQIESGEYDVSTEGTAHAILSYIDEAKKG